MQLIKRQRFIYLIPLFVATVLAQAPPLQLTHVSLPGGGFEVTATNVYNQPAVDYVVTGRGHWPPGHRCLSNSFDQGAGLCFATGDLHASGLPPGGRSEILMPGEHATVRVSFAYNFTTVLSAVIYGDGSSAGDPAAIAQMLHQRQIRYADVREDLQILLKAAADPNTDYGQLRRAFRRREKDHEGELAPATMGSFGTWWYKHPVDDGICDVAERFLYPGEINVAIERLQGWLLQYAASRPPLQ